MRIEIAGVLGTGKTTIASLFHPERVIHENYNLNPFLSSFYQNPSKFAFETELYFLLQHYHQIKRSSVQNLVCDFALIQDLAYGKMGLSGKRFSLFKRIYESIIEELNYPSLLIYLKCNPEIILQRIRNRGRQNERNIDVSFIRSVQLCLQKEITLLTKFNNYKVVEIDTGGNDFVHATSLPEQVFREVGFQ